MGDSTKTNKFLLRIPSVDYASLVTQSKDRDTSINQLILDRLQRGQGPAPLAGFSALDEIVSVFASMLQGIFLFGSRARGESHAESDIDLLLIMEDKLKLDRGVYAKWDLHFAKHLSEVSPHFVLPSSDLSRTASSSIWREVALDGILLWQKDFRASRLMGQLRRHILADDGTKLRRTTHGHAPKDYLRRSASRMKALKVLLDDKSWADTVREAQEIVELCLKAYLRAHQVLPPRVHDVSSVIEDNMELFPKAQHGVMRDLAEISRSLRRDRELAFYGSEDLTPSEFYREKDAKEAYRSAGHVYASVVKFLKI